MGKAVKKLGSALGFGGTATYKPTSVGQSFYDITQEVKPAQEEYAKVLARSREAAEAAAPARTEVLKAMGEAAAGRGPSLAEAQLKAAQDRTLAQQVAAVQAGRGGSAALGQRALLQAMGTSGRELAQQASIARLGERAQFLQEAGGAEQALRGDIEAELGLKLKPKEALRQYEEQRISAVNQAKQAEAARNAATRGAVIGAGATFLGGGLGGIAGGMQPGFLSGAMGAFSPQKKKDGGQIKGPGSSKSDSIPAMLSNGEFVVKADVVKRPGILKALKVLNSNKHESVEEFHKALMKALKK